MRDQSLWLLISGFLLATGCAGGAGEGQADLLDGTEAIESKTSASAVLPKLAFASADINGGPGNEEVCGIGGWVLGNFEPWHGSKVRQVADRGKIPLVYFYIAAKTSGLPDCNVGMGRNLCTDGAAYIRNNIDRVAGMHRSAAQAMASALKGRPGLIHVEPDWFQYTAGTQSRPLSYTESGLFINRILDALKSGCPSCELVADISPWAGDLRGWFANWDRSKLSYGGLVGKRFPPGGVDGKSYAAMAQALGKPIIIGDAYGPGGGPLGYDYAWDDFGTLDRASADGVAVVMQPNADSGHYRSVIDGYRKRAGSAPRPNQGAQNQGSNPSQPATGPQTSPSQPATGPQTNPSPPTTPPQSNPGSTAPPADGPWGFSVSAGINPWWIEVSVQPPSGAVITKVEAIVDNRQWVTLERTSWGTYARSSYVASGAGVVFRAWDQAGKSHDSQRFPWPGSSSGTPPSGGGGWQFGVSPNINENWVEVSVSGPSGSWATKVEAIVNGSRWETLPKTAWGTYGKSFYVARGSSVVFRAWDQTGKSHDSAVTRWLN